MRTYISTVLLPRLSGSSIVAGYCKQQMRGPEASLLYKMDLEDRLLFHLVSHSAGVTLLAHGYSPSPPM